MSRHPIERLPVLCVQNVNELKQHLLLYTLFRKNAAYSNTTLYVWYGIEQSIVDIAINEWRISLQAYLRLNEEIFSKSYNTINHWMNQ